MIFDRRRIAVVLHVLLTAQSAQAGPLRWTDRIIRREVSTPANSDYAISVEATAAVDGSGGDSDNSETTPRPVFQTLTSSVIFPESVVSNADESSPATSTVNLIPIVPTTSSVNYQNPVVTNSVSGIVEETTEQPVDEPTSVTNPIVSSVVDETTEQPVDQPTSVIYPIVSSVVDETTEQPVEPTSVINPIVSTNLAVTPTLTTSIVPQQPTTSAVEETSVIATSVAQDTSLIATSAADETSGIATTVVATSEFILTTSIVPNQPISQTLSSELVDTTTSVVVAPGTTSVMEEITQSYATPSIATSDPATELASTQLNTPGTTSAAEEITQSILTTSIVPKNPATELSSTQPNTPGTTSAAEEITQSILTTSIVPKNPTTELSSTQIDTQEPSTSLYTYSQPVNTPGSSSILDATQSLPGSDINTPATTLEAVPTLSTVVGNPGSSIYQETPGAPVVTTSTALPIASTVPDQGQQYSTGASFVSSVDLGDLKPTTTHIEQTTLVEEPSTIVVPTTSEVQASEPVASSIASTSAIDVPASNVQSSIPETTAAAPETTLTVSVVNPSETEGASSTEAQVSYSAPVSTSEAQVAPSTTSSLVTISEIVATGVPNTAVPNATPMPTGTTTVDAERYASNLAQAKDLNQVYSGLTSASACSSGQAACIDGQFAQCSGAGTYTLSACGDNRQCYALPMTTNRGVRLGCEDVDKAKQILGETGDGQGSTSAVEEPTSTVVVEQPASTSVVEEPATTSQAEEQHNGPVVTVTQVVTVDDGAAAQPTSEPVAEVPISSTQEISVPISSSEPSSEQPVISQPVQTSSVYSAPESSAPAYDEPATTSAPVTEVPTSSAVPSGSTITKSIKVPNQGDSTVTSEAEAEPTRYSTVNLVPIVKTKSAAKEAVATEAADEGDGSSTTQVVDGTPTVSVYMTVTVTEKDHQTVTVTEKERVTVVISA